MIEYTENFKLLKPGKSEKYTIEHQNQNMELIDAALQKSALPPVTSADAGKFLRVSDAGAWAAQKIPYAEEASF